MQLKPVNDSGHSPSVRRRLMAATCALMSASAARAQESTVDRVLDYAKEWQLDSALAYYHEDGRIQAVEPVVTVNKDFADGKALNLTATFDSLSGSSPNGALPSHGVQTFTSPSGTSLTTGRHLYTTLPGQLPVDANYSDDRIAVAGSLELPISRVSRATVGGKVSYEDDFASVTVDASLARDFNEKNTTISIGANNEFDSLSPIGGTPVPRSDYATFDKTSGKTKDGVGVLLGLTQVVTRFWLAELNVSADRFKGYLNDPYKIMTVVSSDGMTTRYEYENRPDQRLRKSVYLENRMAGEQISAGLSLRYMTDDWHVRSNTARLNVRWWLANQERYIEPSVRWYRQTAASFYTPYLLDTSSGSNLYASSDSRLARFHALTYGIKYGQQFAGRGDHTPSELSIRAEYYQQTITDRGEIPVGLQGLDLYPGLKAFLLQIGWRF
jgi:hypothetical protein